MLGTRGTMLLLGLILGIGLLPIHADEKEDEAKERDAAVAKQKALAEGHLKASKLKMSLGESESLLVYAPLSEEKAAKLAATLQKTHNTATKALKMDANPWTGKLSIIVFSENRQFKGYVLDTLKRTPQGRETSIVELKGNAPTLLLGPSLGDKLTEANMASEVSVQLASALINRKAGVGSSALTFAVPEWLAGGFGRAIHARAETMRYNTFRARVKAVYGKSQGVNFKPSNVWDAPPIPDLDLIQASFVDYLAYGPPNSKFPAFVQAFKPEDENSTPSVSSAMMAVEWTSETLEAGWKKWILTGK